MKVLLVLLIGLLPVSLWASDAEDTLRSKYIQQFPDKFFVWPLIKQRELNFDISNRFDNSQELKYRPNNLYSVGVGFNLFELSFELSMAIPLDEKNRSTYGPSDIRDLQLSFVGKQWAADIYSQRYKGFYVENRNQGSSSPNAIIKRSDILLTNTGGKFIYAFNRKKYSIRAAFNYSERQLKSAGSFILAGSINGAHLQADSSVLRQIYSPDAYSVSSFRKLQYASIGLAPGYAQSFIYKDFFLNAAISLGPAHYWIKYAAEGDVDYDFSINTYADLRFAVGYNSDRIFGGLSYVLQSRNIKFEDIEFTNGSSVVKFLIGYRFREFGILKKRAIDFVPTGGR